MNLFDLNLTLPISDPTWVFFLVLIIILFAPMILGRLHIPHIIGMILAGVLIGEHGFHVLDRDSSFELFGKVGLYYIMFLAGLEMDMEDFKKNRTKSFVFGWLTFLIPMALGHVRGGCTPGNSRQGQLASLVLIKRLAHMRGGDG